jgi:hypothetical protein
LFKAKHRLTENSFNRTRKLPFSVLLTYFLNLTKGSYQQELDNFFAVTDSNPTPTQVVTKSALTQARKHLSHTAFIDLNHQVVNGYYTDHPELKTWKGFRLCAIDGSRLRLPNEPDIIETFGVHTGRESQKDCSLALASVYYDVLNHISIDSSINPIHTSERECAASHLKSALPHDLSLLDRGYNAFWLYRLYQTKKQSFCMRAKINQTVAFKTFADSRKAETVVTLKPGDRSLKQCREKGLPITPLKLRLIRVELDNDEIEVLITNLMDEQMHPPSDFKRLYHLRWGIEENYKRLKQWIEIENFSGKSALSVKQDFYAKVLTTNLVSMAANAAQIQVDKTTAHRKLDYQVNFAQAVSKMKNTVLELLLISGHYLKSRLKAIVDYIACSIEPIRPGRSYNRPKSKMKNKLHFCNYKRAK